MATQSLYYCYLLQISASSVSVSFSLSILLFHSNLGCRHGNTTLQSPWGLWERSQGCVDAAPGRNWPRSLSLPSSRRSFFSSLVIPLSLTHYTLLLSKALFRRFCVEALSCFLSVSAQKCLFTNSHICRAPNLHRNPNRHTDQRND